MDRVRLTNDIRAQLTGVPAELCDEAGNVIGHFLPTAPRFEWQPATLTSEERAAAVQEYRDGKCVTTEQILARLAEVRREWETRR
jgi:hypothetical protein